MGWSEMSSMPRLKFTPAEVEEYLALLEKNLQRIQTCMGDLDGARLHTSLQAGEWPAAEVLGHLRACAELWSTSIYSMLVQEQPNLPDIHPRRWMKVRGYELLGFQASFEAFILQRQELLLVLRELPEKDWGRTAQIGERTHSVFSQVRRMALHEAEHCRQLEELLACEGEL
jgi:hypothetical protein